jgi:hypothetical protein
MNDISHIRGKRLQLGKYDKDNIKFLTCGYHPMPANGEYIKDKNAIYEKKSAFAPLSEISS